MALPEHDNDENLDRREEFFAALRNRTADDTYLRLRNHFDEHMKEDGVERAYICLIHSLMEYIGGVSMVANRLYNTLTGDDMGRDPKEE